MPQKYYQKKQTQLKFIQLFIARMSEQAYFQEKTDTFSLKVAFVEEALTFTLKDFTDWAVYQKTYTKKNIGNEIHMRMGLYYVFSAFLQSKAQADKKESQVHKLKKYEFGTVFKNQEGHRCYKIQSNGHITVYYDYTVQKRKTKVSHQSNLILTKLNGMTELEIIAEKQNTEASDDLHKIIQKYAEEKQELVAKICHLEQEVRILKEDQHKKSQINQKNQKQEQQITQLLQGLKIQNNQNEQITQNIYSLYQVNKSLFKVHGLKVTYTGADESFTQFMFNKMIIMPKDSVNLKFKIIQMESNEISFGVVDYEKQKNSRFSFDSRNAMCYFGHGNKWPQGRYQGEGFKTGDIVEVSVDGATRTVQYSVNGALQASQRNEMLADRVFVPYVEMFHTNDEIEWVV